MRQWLSKQYSGSQGRRTCSSDNRMVQSFRSSLSDVDLGKCLTRFLEAESIPNKLIPSPEDTKCEQIFNDTVCREHAGSFIVPLPFRTENPTFGNTYDPALRRYLRLEHRLASNSKLQEEYTEFMMDFLDTGHMCTIESNDHRSWDNYYIPRQYVLKPACLTTRLGVVFDASAKGSLGVSLNHVLFTGPKL